MTRLKPIQKLVLECVRKNTEEDFESFLKCFSKKNPKIDWLDLVNFGPKIIPYAYTTIEKYRDYIPIPKNASIHFVVNYLSTVQRNKRIKQETILLANKFSKAGIDYVFLKGAALIWTVYSQDDGLRPMNDIDLLVRKEDLVKAENLIRYLGFKEEYIRLSRETGHIITRNIATKYLHHYEYFKDGVEVEVHWNLSQRLCASAIQQLISNSTKLAVDGAKISTLNPEGILFLACINCIKDFEDHYKNYWRHSKDARALTFYYYMLTFYEIKSILKCYAIEISWDGFAALAKSAKKEYEIFTLLILAKKIANTDTPEIFLRKAHANFFVFLFDLLCKKISYYDTNIIFVLREKLYITPRQIIFINPLNFTRSIYIKTLNFLEKHNRTRYVFLKSIAKRIKMIIKEQLK